MDFKFASEVNLNHYPLTKYPAGKLTHSMLFDVINLADVRDYSLQPDSAVMNHKTLFFSTV